MARKLIRRITSHQAKALSVVLTIWAVFFYFAMINEVTDELDDSLEDYAEQVIIHALAGQDLPSEHTNSNNQYYLSAVSADYAHSKPHITYTDSMVYIPLKRETEPARILTTIYQDDDEQYYELSVFTPTIEKQDLMGAILFWIIFLYILLLIVIMVVSTIVYERNNRPLYRLLRWLEQYRIGGDNPPLEQETEVLEFQRLNEAALRSVRRSEEVFEAQKQFIGNASHEIQTPVAVAMNRIESLMQDESLGPHQLSELAKTYQTLEYLSKLNKSLLLLYRIDNRQFVERHKIELNELVKQALEDYREIYDHLDIRVEIREVSSFALVINEVLASILVHNLLKNSFVHNVRGGKISIELSAERFRIGNTGESGALDAQLIFERFHQTKRKAGSVGLGLALVKSICALESLEVSYHYHEDMHCFEVQRVNKS